MSFLESVLRTCEYNLNFANIILVLHSCLEFLPGQPECASLSLWSALTSFLFVVGLLGNLYNTLFVWAGVHIESCTSLSVADGAVLGFLLKWFSHHCSDGSTLYSLSLK